MPGGIEEAEVAEPEPPAQSDPTGRWTRTNQVLGKGACKVVFKGFDEQEGLEVAWNQIRMNELVSTKEDRERLFAEIRVLKQLKHKNIMSFHDSWLEHKGYTLNFITELFTSGTLRQYRKKHRSTDPEVVKRWAWQILCGLVYLHGHAPPIIHRDLKCDNIFINGSEGVVKIGDLGLATMLRARTAPQSVLGTPEFMAPELYEEEYDDRVDVYSFGMCLLELATLEYPYAECRNAAQIYRKVTLGVRPKALSQINNRELAEIVSYCLAPKHERPRARHLLKHPYFDSIRNEKLSVKLGQEALGVKDAGQQTPELSANGSAHGPANGASPDGVRNGMQKGDGFILGTVKEDPEGERAAPSGQTSDQTASAGAARPSNGASPQSDVQDRREFRVRGKLQEHNDKLNLRLRILQADGSAKTVEFDFDLASDTAMSVASEMVEEMSLSHGDAHKIAHAIKEEILSLTNKPLEEPVVDSHSEDGSFGHLSHADTLRMEERLVRQESSGTRYEGAHCCSSQPSRTSLQQDRVVDVAEQEREAEVGELDRGAEVGEAVGQGAASPKGSQPSNTQSRTADSASSVHEHHIAASQAGGSTLETLQMPGRPHTSLGFYRDVSPRSPGSVAGSATSLCSSPPIAQVDASASEPGPAAPYSPMAHLSAREQLSAVLPPKGNMLRPSESLLRYLRRTDSADHAQEMQALQQAILDKGGKSRLISLPNEEDRRLPLMKLLENLEGVSASLPIPQGSKVAPGDPTESEQPKVGGLRAYASVPTVHAGAAVLIPDRRSTDAPRRNASPASSNGRPMREASREFQSQPNLAWLGGTAAGPVQKSGDSSSNLSDSAGDLKARSKADMAEARRQAAQTSLKNMESHCLESLDLFGGVAKGSKQQVPLRKMMGGSARIV